MTPFHLNGFAGLDAELDTNKSSDIVFTGSPCLANISSNAVKYQIISTILAIYHSAIQDYLLWYIVLRFVFYRISFSDFNKWQVSDIVSTLVLNDSKLSVITCFDSCQFSCTLIKRYVSRVLSCTISPCIYWRAWPVYLPNHRHRVVTHWRQCMNAVIVD